MPCLASSAVWKIAKNEDKQTNKDSEMSLKLKTASDVSKTDVCALLYFNCIKLYSCYIANLLQIFIVFLKGSFSHTHF